MRRLELSPGFVAAACFAFYLCPADRFWPFAALCAAHELGHLAALSVFGIRVERVRLGAFGAVIQTGPMAPGVEAVCAFAGPGVNLFAFWALRRSLPGAAVISLLLALGNLLPIWPMDGGRVLRALANLMLSLRASIVLETAVACVTLVLLGLVSLLACGRLGVGPAILYVLLLLHIARERNLLLPSRAIPDIMKAGKKPVCRHDLREVDND